MNSVHKAQYAGASAIMGLTLAIMCFGQHAAAQITQHYKQTNLTSNLAWRWLRATSEPTAMTFWLDSSAAGRFWPSIR